MRPQSAAAPSASTQEPHDRLIWLIAALVVCVHLATAGEYDAFRNELYFIVCGRHPAFGYVDQPPLVPLLAAATQWFGDNVWLLRLPAAFAAIALIPLTALLAHELGGERRAGLLAALAVAIAPALAGLTTTLGTSTFEPLCWTAVAYCIARATARDDRRALLWAGCIAGISMQAKYGIAMWAVGLGAGVLLTNARRILRWRECWIGLLIAIAIAAPSLLWQAFHHWPFLEVRHNHSATEIAFTGSPLVFEITQAVMLNPILAPLWLAGVVAPFLVERLRMFRWLAIAGSVVSALVIVLHGKDYYLFPVYPSLFALGAVYVARLPRWSLITWMSGAFALSACSAPLVYPLLSPDTLARYMAATHLRVRPDEAAAVGAPLTQIFSDELGWRRLAEQVATVFNALPADDKSRAVIVTADYGEAAAVDVYGPALGLPPAISGQNQYFLWGPGDHDGNVVIHVNGDPERWRRLCTSVDIVGSIGAPFVMPYENERPIFICRGIKRPLSEIWDRFKRYD